MCSFNDSQYLPSTMHLVTLHWQISLKNSSDCSWNLKLISYIVDHYYFTISPQLTYVIVMFTFRGLALELVSTMSGVMLLGAGTCVCACMHACAWGHMKGITWWHIIPAVTTTGEHTYTILSWASAHGRLPLKCQNLRVGGYMEIVVKWVQLSQCKGPPWMRS